ANVATRWMRCSAARSERPPVPCFSRRSFYPEEPRMLRLHAGVALVAAAARCANGLPETLFFAMQLIGASVPRLGRMRRSSAPP
ncbi:hypothetical protein QT937_003925, partial [Xanthomonas campestris pv. campestris]|uniref:hypothetical protein n=1 Tax=Xanthomonas campestris TaxID=339 RepID=UPI00358FBF7D